MDTDGAVEEVTFSAKIRYWSGARESDAGPEIFIWNVRCLAIGRS